MQIHQGIRNLQPSLNQQKYDLSSLNSQPGKVPIQPNCFRKRNNRKGLAAGMAIQGNFYDYNPLADSSCAGISNPWFGNITLYRNGTNSGNNIIDAPAIANLHLQGEPGTQFTLGRDLTVYSSITIDGGDLNLNGHTLTVKKKP